MTTLTNEKVEKLIEALKFLNNKQINFPKQEERLKLVAQTCDKKYSFDIYINRNSHSPVNKELKCSLLVVYEKERLIAVDIDGAEHPNPDMAIEKYPFLLKNVPCPHYHLFDETFKNIAVPLSNKIEFDKIESVNDLVDIFIKFLEHFNVETSGIKVQLSMEY
jgi:hypothetical protein